MDQERVDDVPVVVAPPPRNRKAWAPREGYWDRLRQQYSDELETALGGAVFALSHARRPDRAATRSSIIFDWLCSEYDIREMPAYVAEDVPCDRTGYPLEKRHCVAERELVANLLEPYRAQLAAKLALGKVLLVGEPAKDVFALIFGKEVANATPSCAHPCAWNKPEIVARAYSALLKLDMEEICTQDEFKGNIAALISQAFSETNQRPDVRANRRAGSSVAWGRQSRRDTQRESTAADWQDPVVRQRRMDGQRLANLKPVVKKRRSDATRRSNENPEVRQARGDGGRNLAKRPGEGDRRSNLRRGEWAAYTQEEKERRLQQIQDGKKKKMDLMTPEQLEERKEHHRKACLERERVKREKKQLEKEAAAAAETAAPVVGASSSSSSSCMQ